MATTILNAKTLSQRLSKRLASFKVADSTLTQLAERVIVDGLDLKKIDICAYGICIDYFTDKRPVLDRIFAAPNIARVEIFPYGIIDWDRFHVRVSYAVDELRPGVTAGPGF